MKKGEAPPAPADSPANANTITRQYFDRFLFEERLIDAVVPDLRTRLLGHDFAAPLMMPAFSHLNHFADEGEHPMEDYSLAAKQLELPNCIGMCENADFDAFQAAGGPAIRIVKPYADREKVCDQLRHAEAAGALAVGMDIDHIFGADGNYDVVIGEPMARVTREDLAGFISATSLPFVVKGVLSVSDAVKCAEAGAKALMISHHSGRLPYAVPPLLVLPDIAGALAGSGVELYCDCGFSSGSDVFKALALGADACAVGRAMMPDLLKDQTDGVVRVFTRLEKELRQVMAFTGCASVKDITPDLLHTF